MSDNIIRIACCYWLTGLSGAGKTTLANAVHQAFSKQGTPTCILDGDQLRQSISSDLGYSRADRAENIRRIGEIARLRMNDGVVVLVAAISPYRGDRQRVQQLFPHNRFFEVFVDADLKTCMERDPKGLYRKAIDGEISHFTGISDPYEPPEQPVVHIDAAHQDLMVGVGAILHHYRNLPI